MPTITPEMCSVQVSGYSDDVVLLSGVINDEFDASDASKHVAFSDGTVLCVEYSMQGVWRIRVIHQAASTVVDIDVNPETDDDRYSDIATLTFPTRVFAVVGHYAAGS